MALTALCVDDRPQVLEIRKATLESHGYCANTASNGHTALKMLEETTVAAVLLEYKLEAMDAEAVAPAISSNGFPTCRSSCFQRTPTCQSESCGWWMNT
jgi:CheY-like chemotaxis protein